LIILRWDEGSGDSIAGGIEEDRRLGDDGANGL
jgi:hypothetical protein